MKKYAFFVTLAVLVFLSTSSGIFKLMLMPQDVEFFSRYGFSKTGLQLYGAAQLLGGLLLVSPQLRFYGAVLVAITFLVSLFILVLDGNVVFSIVTTIATIVLLIVAVQNKKATMNS